METIINLILSFLSGILGGSLVFHFKSKKIISKQKSSGDYSPNTMNVDGRK